MSQDSQSLFGPLVVQDNEAAFSEPWQVQIMALAFAASKSGIFSPTEWSEAFGAELRKNACHNTPDDRDSYYQAALRALQFLLQANGTLSGETILHREEAWRHAYLHTPHGMPVELDAADH